MRGFLIWLVALLLVLSGLHWARTAGSRLPEQHRAGASGLVAAPPARVWELLTETLPQDQWRTGVRRVQTHDPEWSDGLVCWDEWRPLMHVPVCLAEEEAGKRRVVKTHDWGPIPFEATWTYELVPVSGGTQVTIVEDSVVKPPLWRFYGHYVLRDRTDAAQQVRDMQVEGPRRR